MLKLLLPMFLLPLLLLAVTLADRTISPDDEEVDGSETTSVLRYHVAVLRLQPDGEARQECGGAIIHRRFVLTAASCVFDLSSDDLMIRATESDPAGPVPQLDSQQLRRVAKVVYPREYIPGGNNDDVALIKIVGNFDFEERESLKALHLPAVKSNYQKKLVQGAYRIDVTKFTELDLMAMDIKVITNDECQKEVGHNLTRKTLCSRTCDGHVGDPLVYNDYVIGVLSGPNSCDSSQPQVYTRVSEYVDYIVKTIRDQGFTFII